MLAHPRTELLDPTAPRSDEATLAEIRAMSRDELVRRFHQVIFDTASQVRWLALALRVLEEKGYTQAQLRKAVGPLFVELRRVARAELLPELVVRLNGSARRLTLLGSVPTTVQQRLIDGERIPLVVLSPDGSFTKQMADPFSPTMTPELLEQAVDAERGCFRSEEQQILLIHAERRKASARPIPSKVGAFEVDAERLGGVVKGVFVSLEDAERLVSVLREIRRRR